MGKIDHLDIELLSALADGELDLSAARNAQEHLARCQACATQLAAFGRLDRVLAAPAPLSCASATELRSALLDGELRPDEATVAASHLASCASCTAEHATWTRAELALRRMPAAVPPAALDARIARLTAPATRPRFPLTPAGIGGLAARGTVAMAVVIAVIAGLLPAGGGPEQAVVPALEQALVAGVQQAVLYTPTNTLFVLQPADAAVNAVDASSYALRARIPVGGRPTALALNEATSRVLVLDPGQRSLVEIDAERNQVVATTQIPVNGTPTSVQVEPNSGRIIVSAIAEPPSGGPAPTPAIGAQAGVVAVLDGTTKKLETLRAVDVAPQLVVPHPSGKQTLLVSGRATTLVDGSYQTVRTLPGGIAAAFAARSGLIAVLSADAAGSATLHFNGDGAPGPLRLAGIPLAVTSVPEVGFAVLLGSGSGNGRIVVVDEAGRDVGTTEVAQVGRDLAYDHAARRFTVVAGGKAASAALPASVIAGLATPLPEQSLPASPRPSPSAPPSVVPSASPAPSPSPSAPTSPAPSEPVASGPAASPAPSLPAGIPVSATAIRPDLYRIPLPGRIPLLTAATLLRVWFIDEKQQLGAIDLATGDVFTLAQLPRDAGITSLAVGATHVYAADGKKGRLFAFDIATERLAPPRDVPFLRGMVVMTVAPDGRLWMGTSDSAQILSLDPLSRRIEAVDTGLQRVTAVEIDNFARVWASDGDRSLALYDLRSARLTPMRIATAGAARTLLPDPSGSIWVGTTAGEVVRVTDGTGILTTGTGRPISRMVLDPRGVAWYLTPARPGETGFVFGRADGTGEARHVPGAASSLDFSLSGRAWLADPTGGFFVGLEPSR